MLQAGVVQESPEENTAVLEFNFAVCLTASSWTNIMQTELFFQT